MVGIESDLLAYTGNGRLTIRVDGSLYGKSGTIRIFDFNGKLVQTRSDAKFNSGTWSSEFYYTGAFIVVSEIDGQVFANKIISK